MVPVAHVFARSRGVLLIKGALLADTNNIGALPHQYYILEFMDLVALQSSAGDARYVLKGDHREESITRR